METRARLSPVKSTRRRIIVNPNSDYYDHSYQKEKQQPKLLDSVKQQIKDYGHLTQGFEDEGKFCLNVTWSCILSDGYQIFHS